MATNRIKGITIEIGGDTTKLDKALSSVNKTIRDSQSQLKDLNKLLKLDPGNADLLQQKFRTLGTEIEGTSQKLATLKAAEEQAERAMASGNMTQSQYDALQREIVETEQKLKSLTAEYREFGSVQAQQLAAAGEKMKGFGNSIAGTGAKLMPVTLALGAAGAKSVEMAADFEYSMDKVGALSGATTEELDKLKESARQMAKETKFTAEETAQAMQYMALAGWDAEDMLSGLPGILHLAGASGEDLAMVSDVVTDGLTAFGLTADDCSRFVDVLATTMAKSNTNIEMLGESFKYVAPVAGQMGYAVEDVAIATGLMANSGIKASNAGTSLRSVLTRIAKPTKESQMAMDRLGLTIADESGRMYTLMEIMQQLRKAFGEINMPAEEYAKQVAELDALLEEGTLTQSKYEKQLEELTMQAFGAEGAEKARAAAMLAGKTGMAGLMAVVGATEEEFQALTKEIYSSSEGMGAANEMYSEMTDNLRGRMDILKSAISDLAIQLGNALIPLVEKIVAKFQQFADWLDSLSDSQKEMVVKIGLLVAALGPMLIILGKLVSSVGTLLTLAPKIAALGNATKALFEGFKLAKAGMTAFAAEASPLGAALAGISAPMVAIVAVVGVLIAAFKHLWDTNEEFRNSMISTWENIKAKFVEFGQGITERINALGFDFENISEVIKNAWESLCNFLAPIFEGVWKNIEAIIDTALDVILDVWDFWYSVFTGDWEKAWESVKKVVSDIWDGIKQIFINVLTAIDKLTDGKVSALLNNITDKFKSIQKTIGDALDWVKQKFENLQLKFPDIKLPHFKIEGEWDLKAGKVPHLSIDWYKKAMNGGMILNSPTIFGAMGGKLLGAGEAGPEAVVGVGSLQSMIQNAVGSTGIETMVELMSQYLPYLAQNTEIRLDSGALVGSTVHQMNNALGKISAREGRR